MPRPCSRSRSHAVQPEPGGQSDRRGRPIPRGRGQIDPAKRCRSRLVDVCTESIHHPADLRRASHYRRDPGGGQVRRGRRRRCAGRGRAESEVQPVPRRGDPGPVPTYPLASHTMAIYDRRTSSSHAALHSRSSRSRGVRLYTEPYTTATIAVHERREADPRRGAVAPLVMTGRMPTIGIGGSR